MMDRSEQRDPPVLVVADDDQEFRNTLTAVLEAEGYCVLPVANGHAALQLLHALDVAAVILDWTMPVFGGADFWRAQRRDETISDVPVLVLTGDLRSLAEARVLGVARALRKPIALMELLGVIRELCGAGAFSSPDGRFPAV